MNKIVKFAYCTLMYVIMMKKLLRCTLLMVAVASLAACNPQTWKNINYLQDINGDTVMPMAVNRGIIIQPQDQLSIIVTSRNNLLAAQFNKSIATYYTGSEMATSGGSQRITGYVVDNEGDIMFPQIGRIHVAGMNRWELQDMITQRLVEEGLLTDANVTVEFLNFKISVLGEVPSPGTYSVTGDKITIFQALALARDLSIYGKRDNVMVVREQNGERRIYTLDLRNSSLFDSPAYYLQQNDVVYVTPSDVRAGQSTINENYFKSGGFWMSLGSLAITVTNLIITLTRN